MEIQPWIQNLSWKTRACDVGRQQNRRRTDRYGHCNLYVTVNPKSALTWLHKPQVVNWMDFNQFGMSFVGKKKYRLGKTLLVNLSIDGENKESLSRIVGVVRNIGEEYSGQYRCGIEFDFGANTHMQSEALRERLTNIEQTLKSILNSMSRTRLVH